MKVASLLARLAVYALALFVVVTARLPQPATQSTFSTVRSIAPDSHISPARVALAGILVVGILIEVLRRRPVWH